jgi:UDP-N-acetylglucosamine--N-acetylmuramyl-(pentapeptide) pyrophosphoryl-undecaprenol N-acetylglucosamine transferase
MQIILIYERFIKVPLRIVFAGGGTGGHLFPAIAIADELKKAAQSTDITFIGTKYKLEAKIVPQARYAFRSIWISGFQRGFKLRNILFPIKLIVSFIQTYFILKKIHPHVVVGTGGYVAGPVLRTAMFMKIPTLIQEQNSYPGVTTRLLAPNANEVHVTFESSVKYFTNVNNIYVTGNPTRGSLENIDKREALKYFGMDPDKNQTTLLILGGSLGALSINNAVIKHYENLINQGYRIIWQTGTEGYKNILDSTKSISSNLISVKPFIEHMDYAYSAADVVISRAGATTIAELTRLGKPSILVPYPRAAADHQTENARSLADIGAAIMIVDSEISEKLEIILKKIVEDKNLREMGAKSKNLGKPNAASDIAKRIMCLAGEYGRQ